jgi:DNA invertase Pin-like site-specific DNA recombinase
MQKTELVAYAKSRGWKVVKVYEDVGSGTNDQRPKLKELMNAARAREVDCILVWKLDRFARSLRNLLTMLQELESVGVTFVSHRDQVDLSTPAGRLMAQMIGAFAEFEVQLIRMRVLAGLKEAKRKGVQLGRPTIIDRKEVLRLKAKGLSYSQIAKALGCSKSGICKLLKAA